MIRVTYIDLDDSKKELLVTHVLKPLNNCYRFLNIENERIIAISNKCDIKIEKQAKDLTLEECEKLYLEPMYHTWECRLIYVKTKYCGGGSWGLNDYIDITDLVKEDELE